MKKQILLEELERVVKPLKRNKSPGTDGIAGDLIQAGGEIYRICSKTWENTRGVDTITSSHNPKETRFKGM